MTDITTKNAIATNIISIDCAEQFSKPFLFVFDLNRRGIEQFLWISVMFEELIGKCPKRIASFECVSHPSLANGSLRSIIHSINPVYDWVNNLIVLYCILSIVRWQSIFYFNHTVSYIFHRHVFVEHINCMFSPLLCDNKYQLVPNLWHMTEASCVQYCEWAEHRHTHTATIHTQTNAGTD